MKSYVAAFSLSLLAISTVSLPVFADSTSMTSVINSSFGVEN